MTPAIAKFVTLKMVDNKNLERENPPPKKCITFLFLTFLSTSVLHSGSYVFQFCGFQCLANFSKILANIYFPTYTIPTPPPHPPQKNFQKKKKSVPTM
jgi:hypothetical protein